jgi:hypothetical protein
MRYLILDRSLGLDKESPRRLEGKLPNQPIMYGLIRWSTTTTPSMKDKKIRLTDENSNTLLPLPHAAQFLSPECLLISLSSFPSLMR